ncbi:MAG: hypothetical protein ACU0A6_05105 [Shimia sp.]|jgi:hypothetical protein|uniref:hypothetical protein n=1 Tax=Shimia sp. TaxID=1954381 RepID=UPI004058EC1E
MFGFGRRSKEMPSLDDNLKWWVIESERFNLESKASFRIFDAVIAKSEKMAIEHLRISDEKVDKSLMNSAIRAGKIVDEFDWEPVSTLVRHLSVLSVTTEAEVAERDEVASWYVERARLLFGRVQGRPADGCRWRYLRLA